MFTPCLPCCDPPIGFRVDSFAATAGLRGVYSGLGYASSTGFTASTKLLFLEASVIANATTEAALLSPWLAAGGKRLVVFTPGLWALPSGSVNTVVSGVHTRLNALMGLLGLSLTANNGAVLQTGDGCQLSTFLASHYLISGLVDWGQTSRQVSVSGSVSHFGSAPISGGTSLASYNAGTSLAVERLSSVNSEVILSGDGLGLLNGSPAAYYGCQYRNTFPFLLNLIQMDVP